MSVSVRIPRALAAAAGVALGLASLPASASAAPLQPGFAPSAPALAAPAQYWGHPGPRWGWGPPPPRYGWGRPGWHHGWGPRCTVRYVRTWDDWRGGWVARPVRRCW